MTARSTLWFLRGPLLVESPPDGGYGWVVAFACFLTYIIAVGLQYCVGIFYRALLVDVEFTREWSRSELAWVNSTENCCFLGMSLLAGFLINRPSCGIRGCCLVGTGLLVAGFATSAAAMSPGMLYVTYGILTGTGTALPSSAAVVAVSRYFKKRRVLATGLGVAGNGVGALLFGPLVELIVQEHGWRGAMVFLAAVCGVCLPLITVLFVPLEIVPSTAVKEYSTGSVAVDGSRDDSNNSIAAHAAASARGVESDTVVILPTDSTANDEVVDTRRIEVEAHAGAMSNVSTSGLHAAGERSTAAAPAQRPELNQGSQVDTKHETVAMSSREMLTYTPFLLWVLFVCFWGATWFVGIGHFVTFVQEAGISAADSSILILTQGVTMSIGRVTVGLAADSINMPKLRLLQICVAAVGASNVCLSFLGTHWWFMILHMIVNGIFGGSLASLFAPITVDIVGLASLPVANGWFHIGEAPSTLIAPPIAGFMRSQLGSYTTVWALNGCFALLAAALAGLIERSMRRENERGQTKLQRVNSKSGASQPSAPNSAGHDAG